MHHLRTLLDMRVGHEQCGDSIVSAVNRNKVKTTDSSPVCLIDDLLSIIMSVLSFDHLSELC